MYALASDGAVYSWGYVSGSSNHLGRAGLTGSTNHPPAQVDGIGPGSGAIKIATNHRYGVLVLFADGLG